MEEMKEVAVDQVKIIPAKEGGPTGEFSIPPGWQVFKRMPYDLLQNAAELLEGSGIASFRIEEKPEQVHSNGAPVGEDEIICRVFVLNPDGSVVTWNPELWEDTRTGKVTRITAVDPQYDGKCDSLFGLKNIGKEAYQTAMDKVDSEERETPAEKSKALAEAQKAMREAVAEMRKKL